MKKVLQPQGQIVYNSKYQICMVKTSLEQNRSNLWLEVGGRGGVLSDKTSCVMFLSRSFYPHSSIMSECSKFPKS